MSEWGKVDQKRAREDMTPKKEASIGLTKPKASGIPVLRLGEWDLSKFKILEPVTGNNGDTVVPIEFDGQKGFNVDFKKLPEFSRHPFAAGPFMRDGKVISEKWKSSIEIAQWQYDAYEEFRLWATKEMLPYKDRLFPPQVKPGTGVGKKPKEFVSLTDEQFEMKFQSNVVPPSGDWNARFKFSVQHEAGKPGYPKVMLTGLNEQNSMWKPTNGTPDDLGKNVAMNIECSPVRNGFYAGQVGWGINFQLAQAYVFQNKSTAETSDRDMSDVVWCDAPQEDAAGAESANKKFKMEANAAQFMAGDYDDGTGGNGGIPDDAAAAAAAEVGA